MGKQVKNKNNTPSTYNNQSTIRKGQWEKEYNLPKPVVSDPTSNQTVWIKDQNKIYQQRAEHSMRVTAYQGAIPQFKTPAAETVPTTQRNYIDDLNNPETYYRTVKKLEDMGDSGWNVLLAASQKANEETRSKVQFLLKGWLTSKPDFTVYLENIADNNDSSLSDYAAKILVKGKYRSLISASTYRDSILKRLDVARSIGDEIFTTRDKTLKATVESERESFNRFFDNVLVNGTNVNTAVKDMDLDQLIDMSIRTHTFLQLLGDAREKSIFVHAFENATESTEYNNILYRFYYNTRKITEVLDTYVQTDGTASYKAMCSYFERIKESMPSVSARELEGKVNDFLKNVNSLISAMSDAGIAGSIVFGHIMHYQYFFEGLKREIPAIKANAKTDPWSYYTFWNWVQTPLNTAYIDLFAIMAVLNTETMYQTVKKSWLKASADNIMMNDFVKKSFNDLQYDLSVQATKAKTLFGSVKSSEKPTENTIRFMQVLDKTGQEKLQDKEKQIKNFFNTEEYKDVVARFNAFNEQEQNFKAVVKFILAVVITLVAIITAGWAAAAIAPALAGEGVILSFIVTTSVESLAFMSTQKLLEWAILGEVNIENLGYQYFETLVTFGVLNKAGKLLGTLGKDAEGIKKFATTTLAFTGEVTILTGLQGIFALVDKWVLPKEEQRDFKFGESFLHSAGFILALKGGMFAVHKMGPELANMIRGKKGNDLEKDILRLETNVDFYLNESKFRELTAREQAVFKEEVAELLNKKAEMLEDAAKDPANKNNAELETAKKLAELLRRRSLEIKNTEVLELRIRESGDLPDIYYFEGTVGEMKQALLSGGKGKVETSPYNKEIILFTPKGQARPIKFIQLNPREEISTSSKFERLAKERKFDPTEAKKEFWERIGEQGMTEVEGSEVPVLEAVKEGWKPGTDMKLPARSEKLGRQLLGSTKHKMIGEKFGSDVKKLSENGNNLRSKLGELSKPQLENILNQVKDVGEMSRLNELHPDLANIKQTFFTEHYVKVETHEGKFRLRFDEAPLLSDAMSLKLENNFELAKKLNGIIEVESKLPDFETNLGRLENMSETSLQLFTEVRDIKPTDLKTQLDITAEGEKYGFNAKQSVDKYEGDIVKKDLESEKFRELFETRKKALLEKNRTLKYETELNALNTAGENLTKDPTAARGELEKLQLTMELELCIKEMKEFIKTNKLKRNPFENPGAYKKLLEAAHKYRTKNPGAGASEFVDYLHESAKIKGTKRFRNDIVKKLETDGWLSELKMPEEVNNEETENTDRPNTNKEDNKEEDNENKDKNKEEENKQEENKPKKITIKLDAESELKLGSKELPTVFKLIDENGNVVGELRRQMERGNKITYQFRHFEGIGKDIAKNNKYDLKSSAKVLTPETANTYPLKNGDRILYMDFLIPKNITDNISGLGEIMYKDALTYFGHKGEINGIYGEWIKAEDLYADYGGKSINLKKFQDAIDKGMTKEEAAFETVTGQWAKNNDFTKVEFPIDPHTDRVEVIFRK